MARKANNINEEKNEVSRKTDLRVTRKRKKTAIENRRVAEIINELSSLTVEPVVNDVVNKSEEEPVVQTDSLVEEQTNQEIDELPLKELKPSYSVNKRLLKKPHTEENSLPISKHGRIVTSQDDNKQTILKPKRRIHLGGIKKDKKPVVKEVSINQNASFFYEPSIFEKYDISISDYDNDSVQNQEETHEELAQTDVQPVEEQLVIKNSDLDSEIDLSGASVVTNQQETTQDASVESEPVENVPEAEVIEDNANQIEVEIIGDTADQTEVDQTETQDTSDVVIEDEIISAEDFMKDMEIDDLEQLLNDSTSDDTESDESSYETIEDNEYVREAADSIDTPVGKFIDTTSPTNNADSAFEKIPTDLTTDLSGIFKTFSYDEAELLNNLNNTNDVIPFNVSNIEIEDIQPESFLNNVEQQIIVEDAASKKVDVPSVEDVVTTDVTVDPSSEIDLTTNIITPTSTTDDVEDLEDIEELLNKKKSKKTSSKKSKEVVVEESTDDTEEVNEETATVEETVEEDTSDDFDIEAYFGIDKMAPIKPQVINDSDDDEEETVEDSKTETAETTNTEEAIEFDTELFEESILANNEVPPTPEEVNEVTTEGTQEEVVADTVVNENEVVENVPVDTEVEDVQVDTENVEENDIEDIVNKLSKNMSKKDLSAFTKLIDSFNDKISDLSSKVTTLEDEVNKIESAEEATEDDIDLEDLDVTEEELAKLIGEDTKEDNTVSDEKDIEASMENNSIETIDDSNTEEIQDLLSKALLEDDSLLDNEMKEELLSEVLASEENTDVKNDSSSEETKSEQNAASADGIDDKDPASDFLKIIDSLAKTITELENGPEVNTVATQVPVAKDDKAINILINEDDVFSISIQNETYEIVADFDGISVLSDNLHLSTPKNNFFVQVGEKYIEIHNLHDHFSLITNFEDVEFANAINNVTFTKKNNTIELNIKDAFRLNSVNNTVEVSMLNKTVADLSNNDVQESVEEKKIEQNSVCDNNVLLISEETQKVYLPYTIEEVMQKLNNSSEYQTIQEVIDNEYTLPLSTFKNPIVSRFKEAYRFMRVKEKSSVYAALDLAVELMFNSNLNPAIIRACKDMKELNIYLDCLYENEVEKFDCFKIVYKILPKAN